MSILTEAARGKECTLKIYPYCCNDTETTVFAHAPSDDKCMSKKSPDWWGADACYVCHNIVDGRELIGWPRSEVNKAFIRAVFRNLQSRLKEGYIVVDPDTSCFVCNAIINGWEAMDWPDDQIDTTFIWEVFRVIKGRIEEGSIVVGGGL